MDANSLNNLPGPLFYAGVLLMISFLGGRIASYFNAPRITGYLVTGVIFGPSALGLFPSEIIDQKFKFIIELALGFIAFSIGGSLTWRGIKKLGKQILTITVTQALAALLLVFGIVYFAFPYLTKADSTSSEIFGIAIIIGAMSAATAPAAILALVHQYRSAGPLTTILLGIVALDDALTIAFFSLALPIAQSLLHSLEPNFGTVFTEIYIELSKALALGLVMGFAFKYISRWMRSRQETLGVTIGAIFILYGASNYFETSPLLANLVFGFIVTNSTRKSSSIFSAIEEVEEPIFGMFFALAGAHMNIAILPSAGLLGFIIVVGRFSGKYLGTQIGGLMSGLDKNTRKYLGLGLLPKAGVTVGLLMEAAHLMGQSYWTSLMVNTVLASVIMNEILAPFFVKYALFKSGEVRKP